MTTIEIGLLVFPRVQQLDLTGPYEVFASWPEARVRLDRQEPRERGFFDRAEADADDDLSRIVRNST